MTTEVSRSPRGSRSGTRLDVLVDGLVEVGPELVPVHTGAPRNISTTADALTKRCRLSGTSSPTGTPSRVTVKLAPSPSARMTRPLSLRSVRWLISSLTRGQA